MRIAAVVITCNRIALLPRALNSVAGQSRKPDFVYIISNSEDNSFSKEVKLCSDFGFTLIKNHRTGNYAGALNTAVEEIVKQHGTYDDLYFASLDDDDEWLPDYLNEIEKHNGRNYDLLAANYLRLSNEENLLMSLPDNLSVNNFLTGNPGIGGSNTFIRLKTLLKAGCFDEALPATVDRDFFIRVFQQKPTYNIIQRHLVTAHTDKNRERLTTNRARKKQSFRIFFYKHQHLMNEVEKEQFFDRAKKFFSVQRNEIEIQKTVSLPLSKENIQFNQKGDYQFVIGFIAGNEVVAERIVKQISEKNIPVDLVLIIEDVPKGKSLNACEELFQSKSIPYIIVKHQQWKENLTDGHYGSYFKQFSEINSIPLGRTILHHHLFTETIQFQKPVYWIIDDDILFRAITTNKEQQVDLFELVNRNIDKVDAIIGSMSNDPPVPTLCCIRAQLLDFLHSNQAEKSEHSDFLNLRAKPDYYYDLSDIHSDHLEIPLYHNSTDKNELHQIFSGKAVSRPALQQKLQSEEKTITKRGANTLVFNREMLQYYPVINLEVNNKFARRGDLLWALLNQVVSGRKILEHTFSVDHNRPANKFDLAKELDKAAYDIIGYAFNKGILKVIDKIKKETEPNRPKDIFENLIKKDYYDYFLNIYNYFLERRKARFVMNYFRIRGLTSILAEKYKAASEYDKQLSDESKLAAFENTLTNAQKNETLKSFLKELTTAIWTYSKSITDISEDDEEYRKQLEQFFGLKKNLRKLGVGAEGIIFTDENFVYKSYFNILDYEWTFLKEKSACFSIHPFLESIECFEDKEYRFIRYPFFLFQPLTNVEPTTIASFLKFCKTNDFVFTNIKPSNFIQTNTGAIKLIDYGKSFEPFTDEKFLNSIKRAYLLIKFPQMKSESFQKLTAQINIGEEPNELIGWKHLLRAVNPRKREEILDDVVVSIIKQHNPTQILDYGSGKCKTARRLQNETQAEVCVFDINKDVLRTRCRGFNKYHPTDNLFLDYFDVVLLNLVLCEVTNEVVNEILTNISQALMPNGKLIVSVCNPDFAHICKTEFQSRNSVPQSNSVEEVITKTCIYTGKQKTEFHRPTHKYLDLFEEAGFQVVKILDTSGTNIETLELASDFKIFILKNKKNGNRNL